MRAIAAMVLALGLTLFQHQAMAQEQIRFPVLSWDQLSAEQKRWAEDIAAPPRNGKFDRPPFNEFLRSPELATRLTALGEYLRWHSSLPPRLSELAILITAREWNEQYIWHQHYRAALKGGLDEKIIADMSAGKIPTGLKSDEAALYDLATSLYHNKSVSDLIFNAAVAQFGERGVVDAIAILGFYDFVAMTLITAKAEPPLDDVPRLQTISK
jgi:4-carboxymuconolactone decarboxylase